MTANAILIATCIATVIGCLWYRRLAIERGIVATVNSRTLHEQAVPRGGGIVFAAVFSLGVFALWVYGVVSTAMMIAIGGGGAAAAIVGFIDDVYGIRAVAKLALQVCLATWLLAVLYRPLYEPLTRESSVGQQLIVVLAVLFVPVWLMNVYNFIDGIDGMAAIGAVFICAAAIVVLTITGEGRQFLLVFALLGASSLGFLFFNLPPAKMFMGDAGSMFLGYCFAALLLTTVSSGDIGTWTWLAILAYFIADTTTTTVSRMFLVHKWYRPHRSHAYQNLARIHKSHAKVTYGVLLYHIFWALPMAIWSGLRPELGPLAAFLALLPAVLWTIRFGPRLSSD